MQQLCSPFLCMARALVRSHGNSSVGMQRQGRRHVLVAIDASAQSRSVLSWALDHLLRPDADMLHVISVAESPPPPVTLS